MPLINATNSTLAICVSLIGASSFFTALAQTVPDAPADTIIFSMGTSCPSGWSIATETQGLMLLGTTQADLVGFRNGWAPLGDKEDRTHNHCCGGQWNLPSKSISGSPHGGANKQGAAKGEQTFSATLSDVSSGLPFIQLLTCKKS